MATARTCPSSFPIAVVLVLALRESLLAGGFVVKAPVPLQHLQQQQQQQQHSCSTVLDGSAAAAAAAVPRPTRRRCRRLGGSASLGAHDDGETPAVSTSLSGLEGKTRRGSQHHTSSTACYLAPPSNGPTQDVASASASAAAAAVAAVGGTTTERSHNSASSGGEGKGAGLNSHTAVAVSTPTTSVSASTDGQQSRHTAAAAAVAVVGEIAETDQGEEQEAGGRVGVVLVGGQGQGPNGFGVVFEKGQEAQGGAVAVGGVSMSSEASPLGADAARTRGRKWEVDSEIGAPWDEFEDWLLQDTYSRYAIGSGKHVLWRRMVREVPELMERSPKEARQRWLRLTGRLGNEEEQLSDGPPLDSFYLQPPVLEEWEEVAGSDGIGSFRGKVFGQRGLADGTAMTTAPVDVDGWRIQDQYVATKCGVVYELGERRRVDLVGQAQSKLLKFAPVTGLALATAFYALTVLSHHVQVEVFVI